MGPVIGNGQKKAYLEIFLKFYFILIRERGSGEKGREREIGRENEKEKCHKCQCNKESLIGCRIPTGD